jgi:hypothetical protein
MAAGRERRSEGGREGGREGGKMEGSAQLHIIFVAFLLD